MFCRCAIWNSPLLERVPCFFFRPVLQSKLSVRTEFVVAIVSGVVELRLGTWIDQSTRNDHRHSNLTSVSRLPTACSYHTERIKVTRSLHPSLHLQLTSFFFVFWTLKKHPNSVSADDRSIPASKWTRQVRFCDRWTCAVPSIDWILCIGGVGLSKTLWALAPDTICMRWSGQIVDTYFHFAFVFFSFSMQCSRRQLSWWFWKQGTEAANGWRKKACSLPVWKCVRIMRK